MRAIHELKTWPVHFSAVLRGDKTFEVRKDDRHFQCGDMVVLTLFDPGTASAQWIPQQITKRIGWILQGGQFGIEPGYCVFALEEPARPDPREVAK